MEHVLGSDLKVGDDVIEVWWRPNRDTITALRPYHGVHQGLFQKGAQLADFAILKTGMTIDNSDIYVRVSKGAT